MFFFSILRCSIPSDLDVSDIQDNALTVRWSQLEVPSQATE